MKGLLERNVKACKERHKSRKSKTNTVGQNDGKEKSRQKKAKKAGQRGGRD